MVARLDSRLTQRLVSCILLRTEPNVHIFFFFFFNDTATTEIYTLSLHDALPISRTARGEDEGGGGADGEARRSFPWVEYQRRSEEHTSELQSQSNLVCRLLLEKKKKKIKFKIHDDTNSRRTLHD